MNGAEALSSVLFLNPFENASLASSNRGIEYLKIIFVSDFRLTIPYTTAQLNTHYYYSLIYIKFYLSNI